MDLYSVTTVMKEYDGTRMHLFTGSTATRGLNPGRMWI